MSDLDPLTSGRPRTYEAASFFSNASPLLELRQAQSSPRASPPSDRRECAGQPGSRRRARADGPGRPATSAATRAVRNADMARSHPICSQTENARGHHQGARISAPLVVSSDWLSMGLRPIPPFLSGSRYSLRGGLAVCQRVSGDTLSCIDAEARMSDFLTLFHASVAAPAQILDCKGYGAWGPGFAISAQCALLPGCQYQCSAAGGCRLS